MTTGSLCVNAFDDPGCGLLSDGDYMQVFNDDGLPTDADPATIATRVATLLAGTRTQGREAQPIGVMVDYDVSVTGFRQHRVTVRWSLLEAGAGVQVPRKWLRNQSVRWLKGEAEKDSASGSFWVPLPKIRGPFQVRVSLYDEDNVRLAYADTDTFR